MIGLFSFDSLGDFRWGVQVFAVVSVTLLGRYFAGRLLDVLERQLTKTENVWDDAVFEAARSPLNWFILIMGLLWAVGISGDYMDSDLFSPNNLDLIRQLTFVVLIMLFMVRFITIIFSASSTLRMGIP